MMRTIGNKGAALILTLAIMACITIIALAFLSMVTGQLKAAAAEAASAKAFWLAEAGTQQAVYKIKTDTPAGYRDAPANIASTSLGEGTYAASVGKDAVTKLITIVSTGTVQGIRRQIRTLGYDTIFAGAAFAGGSAGGIGITVGNNAYTDSYNSSLGLYNAGGNIGSDGDIKTNADISTGTNALINGDASTGPGGTFNNTGAVTGSISRDTSTTMPAVVIPSLSWTTVPVITDLTPLAPGNYRSTRIDIGNNSTLNLSGPINIYLTGNATSVSMRTGAAVIVSGQLKIFAEGNIDLGNQGIIRPASYIPADVQIYGVGSGANSVTGTRSTFYGVLYGPYSSVTLGNNSNAYGAIVADTITLNTGSSIHYDQQTMFIQPSTATGILVETDWREVIPPQ